MTMTYPVLATRSGDWWSIEVTAGLPANVLGVSQARRLTEVQPIARNLIGDLLEIDPETIQVSVDVVLPDNVTHAVEFAHDATTIEQAARAEAAKARSRAAIALIDAKMTMREAGQVLGVSHQRIKQLVDRDPGIEPEDLISHLSSISEDARQTRAGTKATR